MKLKKIVSLALAGILAVSMLTACGDGATDPTPNEPTEPTVTNYAQLLKGKLEYNPGKKVNAVSNTKLDGAMDVAMEFAADGTISGAYFTAALDHTLYVTNDIADNDNEAGQSFVNAANYLIRELSAENKRQLWIPEGFAHGFCVLTPHARIAYKCDAFYTPQSEGAIDALDKNLTIDWKVDSSLIFRSEKDRCAISFAAYRANPAFSY